jgi:lipopolysaccharide export system protein LptC
VNSLTALSNGQQRAPRITQFGRADGERVFRDAVRHSRTVRLLRVAIPVGIGLAVVGSLAFWVLQKPLSILAKLPVEVGSMVVSGSKIMMQQPRVAGFTRDNRRYIMTAQAAGQDVTKPDLVELHGIHATMEMKEGDTFETVAKDGIYNSKTELLTLSQDILVTTASGYKAWLQEAVVNIKAANIVSEKPVVVKTATWTINANRMEIIDSGDFMKFERGVTVELQPETTGSVAKPGVEAQARKR